LTTIKSKADLRLVAHLLRRAGFGATPEEMDRFSGMDYDEIVDHLLKFDVPDYIPQDFISRFHKDQSDLRLAEGARAHWIYRMVMTDTPLREKMCLFWHRIFATAGTKLIQNRVVVNQINMFREKGVGRFDDLLLALSRDPAMIMWLDNQDNHGTSINENYGREILELFSMGVGNYNEDDIKETARAFTGWSVVNPEYMSIKMRNNTVRPYGYISWQYQYDSEDHDDGEKTILGETGNWNGEDAVRIICENKATAEYIARHLYHFYVADEVPVPQWPLESPRDPKAIQLMVDSYFQNGHSIKAMLETMFKSEFFKSQSVRYARIKSPAEMVVGTMRLAGPIQLPSDETYYAQAVCSNMGQALLGPPSVEGWQGGNEWINTGTYVERINFASKILNNPDKLGVRNIIDRIKVNVGTITITPDELVSACLEVLGPVDVSVMTEERLKEFAAKYEGLGWQDEISSEKFDKATLSVIQLIVCTQEYQTA
jgi:uncharacterized protein (DUF1800 family)